MTVEEQLREPSSHEKGVIRRLVAAEFSGKAEIATQLADCRVRTIDLEGSVEFKLRNATRAAATKRRIPVEADGVDEDGVHIHFLLHVVNGFAKELEVYKDDGTPISRMPAPGDLEVTVAEE